MVRVGGLLLAAGLPCSLSIRLLRALADLLRSAVAAIELLLLLLTGRGKKKEK